MYSSNTHTATYYSIIGNTLETNLIPAPASARHQSSPTFPKLSKTAICDHHAWFHGELYEWHESATIFYEILFRLHERKGFSETGNLLFSKISRIAKSDKVRISARNELVGFADVAVSFQNCGTSCVSLCFYRCPLVVLSKGAQCPFAREQEHSSESVLRIHRAINVAQRLALR